MNISRFFIDRPIFAAVIAVFITLMGAFAGVGRIQERPIRSPVNVPTAYMALSSAVDKRNRDHH